MESYVTYKHSKTPKFLHFTKYNSLYPPPWVDCAQQLQGHDTEVSPFTHQILYSLNYVVIKISYLKKPAKNNAYVFCSLKSGGTLHHCIQICNWTSILAVIAR